MNKNKNIPQVDLDIIRSLVEQVLAEKQIPPPGFELTPEPSGYKKRSYYRATITVDIELWKRVQDECSKLRILPPRFIDSLLWQYFGKPKLSYECNEGSPLTPLDNEPDGSKAK